MSMDILIKDPPFQQRIFEQHAPEINLIPQYMDPFIKIGESVFRFYEQLLEPVMHDYSYRDSTPEPMGNIEVEEDVISFSKPVEFILSQLFLMESITPIAYNEHALLRDEGIQMDEKIKRKQEVLRKMERRNYLELIFTTMGFTAVIFFLYFFSPSDLKSVLIVLIIALLLTSLVFLAEFKVRQVRRRSKR